MKGYFYKILLISAIMGFIIISCDDICETPSLSAIVAGAYTGPEEDPIELNPQGITVHGAGRDSILSTTGKAWLMPLSMASDSIAFVVRPEGETADTIYFYYTRTLRFVSEECGCISVAELDSIEFTTNKLRTVEVVNPSIKTVFVDDKKYNGENIRLFY